jgi:tetratricopeptide (TPR) repeat protein
MIRDANFEDLRRAANRRRMVHLVLGCTVLSTLLTLGVTREVKIHRRLGAVAPAKAGDLQAMGARKEALESIARTNHFWTGAFGVQGELTQLTLAIAELRSASEARAAESDRALQRSREEAELERMRGLASVERGRYGEAISHFRSALRIADAVGPVGFAGGPWPHRDQTRLDIEALEEWEARRR